MAPNYHAFDLRNGTDKTNKLYFIIFLFIVDYDHIPCGCSYECMCRSCSGCSCIHLRAKSDAKFLIWTLLRNRSHKSFNFTIILNVVCKRGHSVDSIAHLKMCSECTASCSGIVLNQGSPCGAVAYAHTEKRSQQTNIQ